jgi:hypothetical protein
MSDVLTEAASALVTRSDRQGGGVSGKFVQADGLSALAPPAEKEKSG